VICALSSKAAVFCMACELIATISQYLDTYVTFYSSTSQIPLEEMASNVSDKLSDFLRCYMIQRL